MLKNFIFYDAVFVLCGKIVIGVDAAILLQNAFPTLEKYIDHIHTVDGVPLKVPTDLQTEIKRMFKNMLGLKKEALIYFSLISIV